MGGGAGSLYRARSPRRGHEGQIPPIRDHLESLGVQLSRADGPLAADQVGTMHAVVLWISFLAHETAYAVKPECRARGIPCLYWSRTSPESLASLIAERIASGEGPMDNPAKRSTP